MNIEIKDFYVRESKTKEFLKIKQILGWKIVSVGSEFKDARNHLWIEASKKNIDEDLINAEEDNYDYSMRNKITLQRDLDDLYCKKMLTYDSNIDKLENAIDNEEERIHKIQHGFVRGVSKASVGFVFGIVKFLIAIYGVISLMFAICGESVLFNSIIGLVCFGVEIILLKSKKYLQNKITNKKTDNNLEQLKSKLNEIYEKVNHISKEK